MTAIRPCLRLGDLEEQVDAMNKGVEEAEAALDLLLVLSCRHDDLFVAGDAFR